MNFRMERINSEMRKCIAEIIDSELRNPGITELISVLAVDTSKDLKTAKVTVSVYGNSEKSASTFEALKGCAGFIRHRLRDYFKDLRAIPQLSFVLDKSMEYGKRIDSLLEDIKSNEPNR